MPHIEPVPADQAEGAAHRAYEEALQRAGRIWNIVATMSPNGPVMRDSMRLYSAVMHGQSPLTRAQREMIAVVTSQANGCDY